MINVVDSIMGSGKTTWAIKRIRQEIDTGNRVIYITPLRSETERIKEAIGEDIETPEIREGGSKRDDAIRLMENNKNIATTHALFKLFNNEILELIKARHYILILDEVSEVVNTFDDITRDDLDLLINNNKIIKKDDGQLVWIGGEFNSHKLGFVKPLCENGMLYDINNSLLMWVFPTKVFEAFKEVYIMTYMFDSQLQKYYFDSFGVEYKYWGINDSMDWLVPYESTIERDILKRQQIKGLINIYEGRLNDIGRISRSIIISENGTHKPLSSTWYKNSDLETFKMMKNLLYNYFKNIVKTKLNMWTTLKNYRNILKGDGYSRGYVPCNARATNDYRDKISLAYMINRFEHPMYRQFFTNMGVTINEDKIAVAELLQWIWRSRIREGNKINLYIPSERMRSLLVLWLDNNL